MEVIYAGIVWKSTTPGEAKWYYHAGEGIVLPYAVYNRLHAGHAVLPVEPTTGSVQSRPVESDPELRQVLGTEEPIRRK